MISAYIPTQEEINLRAYCLAALAAQGFATTEVIYANQNSIRPKLPFVTIQVTSENETTTPEVDAYENVSGSLDLDVMESKRASVQVSCFGPQSKQIARAIGRYHTTSSIAHLAINRVSAIQNIPEPTSIGFEQRHIVELEVSFTDLTTIENGATPLETMVITSDIYREVVEDSGDVSTEIDWPTT